MSAGYNWHTELDSLAWCSKVIISGSCLLNSWSIPISIIRKTKNPTSYSTHTYICKHSLDEWYHPFERHRFRIKKSYFLIIGKIILKERTYFFLFKFLLPCPTSNRLSNLEKFLLLKISLFPRTEKFMKHLTHNMCSVNTNIFFLILFFPKKRTQIREPFHDEIFWLWLDYSFERVNHFLIHLLIKSRLSTLVSLPWWTRHNLLDMVNTEPGFSSQVVGKFQLQELSTIKGGHEQKGTSTLLTDTDCYFIFGK